MTQAQLTRAVAGVTGESLRTVRARGFSLLGSGARDPESVDPRLVLDCPFCGRLVAYPGQTPSGTLAPAECLRCDVEFDCAVHEVDAA
jgi:hypothetical protein